tara:strand:+ start:1270 stop:2160 length:891 start_codon:yes stop_codon:yes gene_type:complete
MVEYLAGNRIRGTSTEKPAENTPILSDSGISKSELKAYWRFNETSGNVTNQASTVGSTDSMGTNADLSISGSPSYNQTGSPANLGNNMLFGASGAYGTGGTTAGQWDFLHNQSGLFTICYWAKFPSGVTAGRVLLDDHRETDSGVYGLDIRLGSSNFRLYMSNGVNGHKVVDGNCSANSIPDNNFHFYCWRWDYTLGSNNLKFRRDDGNEELFQQVNTASNTSHTDPLTIADQSNHGTNKEPTVNIAEMSIWNRILTSAEETALYQESLKVQDGAVYYETDTNKSYVLSSNVWSEL